MEPIPRLNAALEGRYGIERELGEGGMATVYLAEDVRHERRVALKVLRPELVAVIGAERFLAEIRTTANLQHPHILPLFDSGEADGFLYYVMPYVDGETLRDRLDRERQLGVEEAVRIARDVADALDYAHRQGVIHRDIKPANVLLHDGRPLVADFGIALAVSAAGGGRMTETGMSLGTPHYMSPEQASADRDLSARSDVYSLGCVLYEMLAGQPPHTGSSAQRILVSILTEDPRPLTDLRRTVPRHVAGAVAKAVEKLPADRFESAKAFMDALADPSFAYASAPGPAAVLGRGAGGKGRSKPPAGVPARGGSLLPWAITGVASAAALLLWVTSRAAEPSGPPVPVRAELTVPGVDASMLNWPETRLSPDGRMLATVYSSGPYGVLAVRRSDEADFRTIVELDQPILGITFSPDGDWIAYGGVGLSRVAVTGGAPVPILQGSPNSLHYPLSWTEDGSILFTHGDFAFGEAGTSIVRATGGEPVQIDQGMASSGQFLSERHLLLGVPGEGARLLDLESDTSWLVVEEAVQPRFVTEVGRLFWTDPSGTVWAASLDPLTGELGPDRNIVLTGISVGGALTAHFEVARNGTLVYSVGAAGNPDPEGILVSVALDGTVTPEPMQPRGIGTDPRWSPDGRFVAYTGREGGEAGFWFAQIYVYDMVARGRPRALTSGGTNAFPVWSPDGSRVLYGAQTGGGRRELHTRSADGSDPAQVVLSMPGTQTPLDWLEDDRVLFVQGPRELWILDLPGDGSTDAGSARPYIQLEIAIDDARAAPQGDLVAYATRDENGNPAGLYLNAFPEPGAPTVVSPNGFRPVWSPDGRTLYFREWRSGSLVAAAIDRGPPVRVGAPSPLGPWPSQVAASDMHPDGTRLVGRRLVLPDSSEVSPEGRRYFIVTNWFEELRALLEEDSR